MKKCYLFSFALFILAACAKPAKNKALIVKWTDSIISQNTNYHSNELVRKEVSKEVDKYVDNSIKENAPILEGVTFRISKIIEDKDSCVVIFDATTCYSDVKKDNDRHLITDIIVRVLGKVDNEMAAKLDEDATYYVSGIVHKWDKEDRFFASKSSLEYIDFGTFIMNSDITIKKTENE